MRIGPSEEIAPVEVDVVVEMVNVAQGMATSHPLEKVDKLAKGLNLIEMTTVDSYLTDIELIEQARTGDQRAFGKIVSRHQARVAATVIGMLGRTPEADDIGQEVFVRFYKSMESFRGEANLSTYLTRIAINLSLNELKRRKKWYERFLTPTEDRLSELPAPAAGLSFEDKDLIAASVTALKPDHRAVVVLRLIDGYSTKETAKILKLPLGTVLSRLARAQEKLKTMLDPYYGDAR